jgi:DNA repair exonuclease SbcCD ATPase subunit
MSDTPRTDAAVFAVDVAFTSHDGLASEPKNVVEPDFARELERENAALRSLIDDPNAMHSHYLRECNGWEVWQAERIRRFQDASEQLEQLERENAALGQELEDVNRVRNSIEGALADAYDEAEADWMSKSHLADAAEEVMNAYINVLRAKTGHPCPENLVICRDLRAAIDAARKEAQL